MLAQHSKIPSQRKLLDLIRLLALQNPNLDPMILSKLHNHPVRNPRPRPLHKRISIRAPRRTQANSMANSIIIHIQRSSIRSKLGLILTRNPSLEIRVPGISLQILVEMGQARQDLEVLVAGRGRERLGDLRGPRERGGRGRAFQFLTEEFLEQGAEVYFGACLERREEDVETRGEA
jgi:hypothetical protein